MLPRSPVAVPGPAPFEVPPRLTVPDLVAIREQAEHPFREYRIEGWILQLLVRELLNYRAPRPNRKAPLPDQMSLPWTEPAQEVS